MRELARRFSRLFADTAQNERVLTSLGKIEASVDTSARDSVASKLSQLLLLSRYREMTHSAGQKLDFGEVEFRAFSQNGEDGILLYLFALLGAGGRRVVEICAGDGIECNAANLLVNHSWEGLLIDGNPTNVERGLQFYKNHPNTASFPPRMVQAWVTRENVNDLVRQHRI